VLASSVVWLNSEEENEAMGELHPLEPLEEAAEEVVLDNGCWRRTESVGGREVCIVRRRASATG
jgi:hypothetical protein